MILDDIQIMLAHGKQYISNLSEVELPYLFRGRPEIEKDIEIQEAEWVEGICPSGAFKSHPVSIDLGKCVFCKECEIALPEKIRFTNDFKIATNERDNLVFYANENKAIEFNQDLINPQIIKYFGQTLKLRQISAGSDNSCEMELNAAANVNFDMGRFGIEWVASPRHADGIVITGQINANMIKALELAFEATPDPKLLILVGTDAISGGVFQKSNPSRKEFFNKHKVDLYIPGNPAHPLTFIMGLLKLTGRIEK